MCVVVRRYIDSLIIIIITYPYSTCISFFWAAATLLLCSFLKNVFSFLFYYAVSLLISLVLYALVNATCAGMPL